MAVAEVIQHEVDDAEFAYKCRSGDATVGTQLVVYPGQTAFFVRRGKILNEFQQGTYTMQVPSEVWFINRISKLDIKWGTPTPIQLEDPRYGIIVPVRAFGQYGIRVSEPRRFLEMLLGNVSSFTVEQIEQYFKGKVLAQLSSLISQKIAQKGVSVLDINAYLTEMSEYCGFQLNTGFKKYGLEVVDFSIISVNVPLDDPSIVRLKEAKDVAAHVKIIGRDVYRMERSFDLMKEVAKHENAASNISTGVSAGIVKQLDNVLEKNIEPIAPPPPPEAKEPFYFLCLNNQQEGGFDIHTVKYLITKGDVKTYTLVWKAGMPKWTKIVNLPEFKQVFIKETPLT